MTIHQIAIVNCVRLTIFAVGLVGLGLAPAFADNKADREDSTKFIQRGTLTCTVAAGLGLVVGSSKALDCSFAVIGQRAAHRYTGEVNKLGIDVGFTGQGNVVWAVYAHPKTKLKGKLSGSYSGLSAEVTAGLGLGAKALVGEQKEIALQPLKIDGQTGINVALGIASVKLLRTN